MSIPKEKNSLLDVYARPFVPQVFKAINQAAATVIPSLSPPRLDFQRYVQAFAGSSFLTTKTSQVPTDQRPSVDHDTLVLNSYNYQSFFYAALDDESAAQQQQCDDHALYRAHITPSGSNDPRAWMHTLHVPGLREMSLRIEVGDIVQLRQLRFDPRGEVLPPSLSYPEFQHDSIVWSIDRRSELLSLRVDNLMFVSMLFNVCFTVQTARVNALHQAVASTADLLSAKSDDNWMRSMLFPEATDGYYQKLLNKAIVDLDLHDQELNYEQQKAINTVLNENYGPVPFIVSGPPGTGKTKTIVELALQKINRSPNEHLLLCAPSDPAADTLVQRLRKHLEPPEILRINSPARSFPEVPGSILPYCCVDDGTFSLPSFKHIMSFRIVVTTCRDAQMLIDARLSNYDLIALERGLCSTLHPNLDLDSIPLHWTSLLIDEAAQATEPEALIPMMVVAPPKGDHDERNWPDLIMAGDQHQLGSRTASKKDSIQTSLLERLLNRPFYNDHVLARSKQSGGVVRPLTQEMLPILRPAFANLIRNYRSHSAILATPSSLFYNDTLEPEAKNTESLLSWSGWKRHGWPVLFAKNDSQDEIEHATGGGWFNINEATIALRYASWLMQAGPVEPHEICIMSPFQAQVRIIRKRAREAGLHSINIGPLEAFQGLESRVVILCTTRTRNRFIDQDVAKGLGVIHEPKRFNVALTRAKEGLIVIGNPEVLKQDENWRNFLAFCSRNSLSDGAELEIHDESIPQISRLERQLVRRDKNSDTTEGTNGLANGFRQLGSAKNEDDALWQSGVEVEASLTPDTSDDVSS